MSNVIDYFLKSAVVHVMKVEIAYYNFLYQVDRYTE